MTSHDDPQSTNEDQGTTYNGNSADSNRSTHPMKVLVVDDNADNREVLTRMLELGGYEAICAANGQEALAVASKTPPELVLMDLAMPGMDGWAATEHFKANPELRHIPIIVVTGHVTGDEIHRAQQVGCQDIVSKPIDYYVLIDKVRTHTDTLRSA